jgi:uncharacterized C2H2 Zn-finger protein
MMPPGLWRRCPRCSHEFDVRKVFAKANLTRLLPDIVTCPNCGAHFTYSLRSFRVGIIALCCAALMCAWLAVLQYYLSAVQFNVVAGATLLILMMGVGTLALTPLQIVEKAKHS